MPPPDDADSISKNDASEWFTPWRFSGILAVLIFLAFPDVVLGWKTFFHHDYGVFGYPLAAYHRESFWRGEIPLWNPLSGTGLPFLAQWNTMTLYPGTLIYLLLPMPWSLNMFCLTHLFLAGLGMYFLALRWNGNRLAASVAGTVFALNGLSLSCLVWPSNVATYGLMPWVIWAVERGIAQGGRAILAAILSGALQMLTGSPETIVVTWVLAVIFPAFSRTEPSVSLKTKVVRLAAISVAVAGVCAAQLLPFIDFLQHSQRNTGSGDISGSMPATGWANFLVPLFRMHPERYGVFFQSGQNWINSYYIGIAVLALAFTALARVRERRVWMLGAIALLGALLALGKNGFLHPLAIKLIPALGVMNFPVKFILFTVFCLPLLAAYAVAHLSSTQNRRAFWKVTGTAAALLLLSIGLVLWFEKTQPFVKDFWPLVRNNALVRAVMLLSILGLLAWSCGAAQRRRQLVLWVAVIVLLAFDVITHAPRQNPTITPEFLRLHYPHEDMSSVPKLGEGRAWLDSKTQASLNQLLLPDAKTQFTIFRRMMPPNLNLLDGIPKLDSFYPLYLRETAAIKDLLDQANIQKSGPAFDFLGVAQIPDEKIYVWRQRETFLPLVTGGQRPIYAEGDDLLRGFFATNFAPREVVFLEPSARTLVTVTNQTSLQILQKKISPHEISIITESSTSGLLVLAQSFYHPWRAYVDGHPTPILRANYAYQATQVPAGRHEVTLRYEDGKFKTGALVSLVTLGLCALAYWRFRPVVVERPVDNQAW